MHVNCRLLNHALSTSLPSTPYELWTDSKPNFENLQPWGSAPYVHTTFHLNRKLGSRWKKCIFIHYSSHSKRYVFLGEHEDGSVTEIESRDVNVLEEEFLSKGEVNQDSNFYELDESAPNCPMEILSLRFLRKWKK